MIKMLRQELDGILMFINEATLNDTEWRQVKFMIVGSEVEDSADINPSKIELKNKYQALYVCLKERSGEGNSAQRLRGYFIAKGVTDPRVNDPRVTDSRDNVSRVCDSGSKAPSNAPSNAQSLAQSLALSFDLDGKSDLCNIIVGGVLE